MADTCGIHNPGGKPCEKEKGHNDSHDEDAYGPHGFEGNPIPDHQEELLPERIWAFKNALDGSNGWLSYPPSDDIEADDTEVEYIRADLARSAALPVEGEKAFEKWWATKLAEGYQYGREPLANVRFGFEAGFAAARSAPVVPQCQHDFKWLGWPLGNTSATSKIEVCTECGVKREKDTAVVPQPRRNEMGKEGES